MLSTSFSFGLEGLGFSTEDTTGSGLVGGGYTGGMTIGRVGTIGFGFEGTVGTTTGTTASSASFFNLSRSVSAAAFYAFNFSNSAS